MTVMRMLASLGKGFDLQGLRGRYQAQALRGCQAAFRHCATRPGARRTTDV
jgi:hypothetical protein